MALTPKTWENAPSPDTPLSAAALIDTEERLGAYADSVAAGGVELGYAAMGGTITTTSATIADISGLEVTVDVGTRPIVLEFGALGVGSNNAAGVPIITMREGSTSLKAVQYPPNLSIPGLFRKRLAPTAGAHSYKISWNLLLAFGTLTVNAGAAGGEGAYIAAYEV